VAEEDHSDADCIAVIVLTHGEENGLMYIETAAYSTVWICCGNIYS
jgi:hypothetical protein